MTLFPVRPDYPAQAIRVTPFPADFPSLFPSPNGLIEGEWPPVQLSYLGSYLDSLGCKTIIIEEHYVDRDYINDVAAFYSRSLRDYPNYCRRLHFFTASFDDGRWRKLVLEANQDDKQAAEQVLAQAYLGFIVVRPLAGSPVGRTVLKTHPTVTPEGLTRSFGAIRDYSVHLAGFSLNVRGLAFQQQDRGVSACATTALWSSIHKVAPLEGLAIPTPAEITEAASRYFLAGGRSLPSEGLTIHQICEATRAAGLAPLVIPSVSPEQDRAQLLGYTSSGLAPILALRPTSGAADGHAVCCVGIKLGNVQPQPDDKLHYRDAATAVESIYVHDDRLGPYASADILPFTFEGKIRTGLSIRWPGTATPADLSILTAFIIPVPIKLRLTIARMRALGIAIADALGHRLFPEFDRLVTLDCRYRLGTDYMANAYGFGLSEKGIYHLVGGVALSRYVGLIEFSQAGSPLFDLIMDATETKANPAALACVRRKGLPAGGEVKLRVIAKLFCVPWIE